MGLEDWIPEKWRQRTIDAGLKKAAQAADRAGMPPEIGETLLSLRTDVPFLEDMAAALGAATDLLAEDMSVRRDVAEFLASECKINEGMVLRHLEAMLFTVAQSNQAALDGFVDDLTPRCPQTIPRSDLVYAVTAWSHLLRQQLWGHPKLIALNDLYMQYTHTLATQRLTATMSELTGELSAFHQTVRVLKPQLATGAPRNELTSGDAASPTRARPQGGTASTAPLPDILTPDVAGKDVVTAYQPVVGEEAANWLASVQERVIRTIEVADFEQQDKIADEILGSDLGLPDLTVTGHYLQGEARRLMSDMARDPRVKATLQAEAITSYETAIDLSPGETRAIRGLARTLEVQGDIGRALVLFEDARIRALTELYRGEHEAQNGVFHEVLRSTRHYAACIVDAIEQNPWNDWSSELGILQLHGLVAESDQLHRATLGRFSGSSNWIDIEWFMGLVLLAKGYSRVHDNDRAWHTLLFALMARSRMFDPRAVERSTVELANLRWWCDTALRIHALSGPERSQVEALQIAVQGGNPLEIESSIRKITKPIAPPWSVDSLQNRKEA